MLFNFLNLEESSFRKLDVLKCLSFKEIMMNQEMFQNIHVE